MSVVNIVKLVALVVIVIIVAASSVAKKTAQKNIWKQDDNTVFEYVKSIDGEWVNFRLEADDTGVGGYWLTADSTVIPEPATYASILGALAIAFALMRRQTRK